MQTLTRGLVGVSTALEPRAVIRRLRELVHTAPPAAFREGVPVDLWMPADIEAMKSAVARLRAGIVPGEMWRMTVETRGGTAHHRDDVIRTLAELVDAKVDLGHPTRILRVEILGPRVAMALLTPDEVFSLIKERIA